MDAIVDGLLVVLVVGVAIGAVGAILQAVVLGARWWSRFVEAVGRWGEGPRPRRRSLAGGGRLRSPSGRVR
jgi:hypothetical protein